MIKALLFLTTVIALLIPYKRALHMFQQNRYELHRYQKWIIENIKSIATPMMLIRFILLSIILIFSKNNYLMLLVCIVLLLSGLAFYLEEKSKSYIKPLVYTARVKRQLVVMAMLTILVFLIVWLCKAYWILPLFVICLGWLLIWPMGLITMPIEASIRNKYMNEAKNILKEHSDLIKIGITGSYGKTSTKNIIQSMISEQYNSLMTPASYNTPNGITITIREMLKPIHKVFICEMGADHVGDITELVNLVHPTIGVVTSIGPQHLQTFGSQENITNEKMQMIETLQEGGLGVINLDNEFIRNYTIKNTKAKIVTYGIQSKDADYRAEDIQYNQNGSTFTVVHNDERIPIETKLLGEHNILNILSAIVCARELNTPWETIQRAAKTMKQVEHRLELKIINQRRFIDDAFNSNPVGAKMALDVLSMMPNKRFIVTPGMIDLGKQQETYNKEFGKQMKDRVDVVILVGKVQTKPIYEGLEEVGFNMDSVYVVDTVKEAFGLVYAQATPQDTILLENDLPDAFSH